MSAALRGALRGVRVLDVSRVLAGPFAGQLLADLGADVIKVEQPGTGDETRSWGPPYAKCGAGEQSAYFQACNRGKRALALDLGKPEGRKIFLGLVAKSDVVLENFKPSSAQKLGLTPGELLKANPRLVVCSVSGFGRDGSYATKPGYDFVIQGMSGLMASTGPIGGQPHKVGVALVDVMTGLYAANAIQAALRLRETSGHGYAVDVALFDCAASAMVNVAQACLVTGKAPLRQGNGHLQIVPYELFSAKDGLLVLAVGNDGQWQKACDLFGQPDWAKDARFATNDARVRSRTQIVPQVAAVLATRTVAEWLSVFELAGVPAGPVWNVEEMLASDVAASRGLKVTLRRPDGTVVETLKSPLVGKAGGDALPPPALGEHTDTLLSELLGIDQAEAARLRSAGVTG